MISKEWLIPFFWKLPVSETLYVSNIRETADNVSTVVTKIMTVRSVWVSQPTYLPTSKNAIATTTLLLLAIILLTCNPEAMTENMACA
jgi:hypothetical protein